MREEIDALIDAIHRGARRSVDSGRPEAVLREYVQPALSSILSGRGVRPTARDEVTLAVPEAGSVSIVDAPLDTKGRADAIYNRFVIEFEPPGSLRPSLTHSRTRHAVDQVQQYLRGVADESGLPLERLAGCAFDGTWIVYVTCERGTWQTARPLRANRSNLARLVETVQSLASGRGFTAANLYEDFGRESEAARHVVRALFRVFQSGRASSRTLSLFDQWRLDLGNASGPFSSSDLDEWVILCRTLGVAQSEGYSEKVLFCLQTYFSLVAKLAAIVVLEGATAEPLVDQLTAGGSVRRGYARLESGELTSVTRTLNAIEPGVFSWYLSEADPDISDALSRMAELISEYSAEVVEITPSIARDVLKDLYQQLLPGSIRHRLGEYYTPDWLAQRVMNQVTGSPEFLDSSKRILDPACGSGTFLVEAISRMVRTASGEPPNRTLQRIVENVVGFDLSPLAVQATKVNYLLALAPLLRHATEPISLPVYLADSVSPPRRGDLIDGDFFLFDSSEGQWRVPAALAAAQYLPVLGEIFKQALTEDRGADWVRREFSRKVPIVEDTDQALVDSVRELFNKIQDLHSAGRDGLWWQLITNAFAPELQESFDYVVGNPPWVSWETLPSAYRQENDKLWLLYGLRPDTPLKRRQSSRNVQMDIAMLFVAVSVDRYLREGGRLGFVITASVFKSELAGRGFRHRRLPSNGTYRFLHIDDMSELRVFDGPQNQTAVLVALKRPDTHTQVPISKWAATSSRTIPTNSDLASVSDSSIRRNLYGEPADPKDLASPLLIMPRVGLTASRPLRRTSPYFAVIREGANTRGLNGVFFLEVLEDYGDTLLVQNIPSAGRNRGVRQIQAVIEKEATRFLLRGSDVSRGNAQSSSAILFFHDKDHVSVPIASKAAKSRYPGAFEFALKFECLLRKRSKFRAFDPTGDKWLGLYSITTAALAKHKVVVREIASGMVAAAVHSDQVIPDHKLYVIPCSSTLDADRLAFVLNSRVVDYMIRSFSNVTSITGSFLRYIGVRDLATVDRSLEGDELLAEALGLSIDQFRDLDMVAAAELPSPR